MQRALHPGTLHQSPLTDQGLLAAFAKLLSPGCAWWLLCLIMTCDSCKLLVSGLRCLLASVPENDVCNGPLRQSLSPSKAARPPQPSPAKLLSPGRPCSSGQGRRGRGRMMSFAARPSQPSRHAEACTGAAKAKRMDARRCLREGRAPRRVPPREWAGRVSATKHRSSQATRVELMTPMHDERGSLAHTDGLSLHSTAMTADVAARRAGKELRKQYINIGELSTAVGPALRAAQFGENAVPWRDALVWSHFGKQRN